MESRKNILIFSGLFDKKLKEKIFPILESDLVNKVFLIRKDPFVFSHPKLKQYNTLKIFRKIIPLSEANRLIVGLIVMLFNKIDILIGIHYLMHCVYAYILARLFNKKYIFLLIESPDKYKGAKIFVKMLKGANIIGVKGSRSLNYVVSLGVPKEKLVILPNEFSSLNISENVKKKIYDLIFIGNFRDVKDLPLWVSVFAKVKKEIPNVTGVMLGDGPRFEEIKELIKSKGLDKNITLAGRQTDVYKYIDVSKIMLLTSVSEGLPMVVVESMSRGVPAVCTNVGDITDIIESGEDGLIINSRNPDDFSREIVKLLKDEEKLRGFSNKAVNSLKKQINDYSREKIIMIWDEILKKIS